MESENNYLREEVSETHAYGQIIGHSAAIGKLLEQIDLVAPTTASVLILGESGTGKELVARAIHQRSERSERPLVKVNFAAVPRERFESEFFGHVKGSFTGAMKDRTGRFQLAGGGTLFLDEVGEIPLDLQGKLLRVLQEGHIERVGDDQTRRVDVRVIAATNRDLLGEVAAGRFRQDLYFRLSVFPIEVVPLRERPADIPLLAQHFCSRLCVQMNRPGVQIDRHGLEQLQAQPGPATCANCKTPWNGPSSVPETGGCVSIWPRQRCAPGASKPVERAVRPGSGATSGVLTRSELRRNWRPKASAAALGGHRW